MVDFTSRQLRAFLLVAQHRSFSRAAEDLFITPSGLSVLIRELEAQLGFRLFDRTTRRVALTPYGLDLAATARRTLGELDEAVSRVRDAATEAGRSLALGTTPLFASNVLPNAIKEFRAQRPDVRIRVFDGDRAAIIEMVERGALDVGLGVFFRPAAGVYRTKLFPFSLLVVRPATDSGEFGPSTRWTTLAGTPLISLAPNNPMQQLIDKHLSLAKIVPPRNLVLNYLDTQIAMVEAGEGIAVIPSFGLPACRKRRVVVSRLVDPVVTLDFYRIHARGKRLPSCAEEFTAFLERYVAGWKERQGIT